MFFHLNQSRITLYRLHHKHKWMSHFQIVNIYLLLVIYWNPKKLDNLHLQELMPGHMHGSSKPCWKISKKWLMHMRPHGGDYTWLYEMLCVQGISWQFTMKLGSTMQKFPYVTMKKKWSQICGGYIEGPSFSFIWFF